MNSSGIGPCLSFLPCTSDLVASCAVQTRCEECPCACSVGRRANTCSTTVSSRALISSLGQPLSPKSARQPLAWPGLGTLRLRRQLPRQAQQQAGVDTSAKTAAAPPGTAAGRWGHFGQDGSCLARHSSRQVGLSHQATGAGEKQHSKTTSSSSPISPELD